MGICIACGKVDHVYINPDGWFMVVERIDREDQLDCYIQSTIITVKTTGDNRAMCICPDCATKLGSIHTDIDRLRPNRVNLVKTEIQSEPKKDRFELIGEMMQADTNKKDVRKKKKEV